MYTFVRMCACISGRRIKRGGPMQRRPFNALRLHSCYLKRTLDEVKYEKLCYFGYNPLKQSEYNRGLP